MKTLEQYLRDDLERGVLDHSVRAVRNYSTGIVTFYIHPTGVDGDTLDFAVVEDRLYPMTDGLISVAASEAYKESRKPEGG